MKKLYVLLFFFSLLVGTDAVAQTIRYVKSGGTGNGTTWATASGDLQAMINASAANDEVWVAAGTYYPTELMAATLGGVATPTTNRDRSFVLKAGVKVYGGFIGTETFLTARNYTNNVSILSGDLGTMGDKSDNAYHVVATRNNAIDAVLDGFTIQDGNANGTGSVYFSSTLGVPQSSGPAIAFRGAANNVAFSNLIIKDNVSTNLGGAAYLYVSKTTASGTGLFPFKNVSFINNENTGTTTATNNAGAVYITTSSGDVTVSFTDCLFRGNKTGGSGGAIHSISAGTALQLTNTKLENNSAGTGGAVYFTTGTFSILKSTFQGNKSLVGSSGAVYMGTSAKSCLIEESSFLSNESITSAGAIYFYSNSALVKNNRFYNNKATTNGGAFFLFGVSTARSEPMLANNLFYNNEALASGGALYCSDNAYPSINNNTLYGNKATGSRGGAIYLNGLANVTVNNSIIYKNTALEIATKDIYNGSSSGTNLSVQYTLTDVFGTDGQNGNIVGKDPVFETEDPISSEFLYLKDDLSPTIDAGQNNLLPAGITTDLAGNDRVKNVIVDLGAFEYDGAAPVPPLQVSINENLANGSFVAKPLPTLSGTLSNWVIITGNGSSAFAINVNTGNITVANSAVLDYEKIKNFTITVKVSNNLGEEQIMRIVIFLNNLMEDPGTPIIASVQNGLLTTFKPKLSGKAEPLSAITIYVDDVAYPVTSSSNADGDWVFNFTEELAPGQHTFHIVATNNLGTSNPSDKATALLRLFSGEFVANNILTPNGDGKNDLWVITDLQIMYPKNEVTVYDKTGKVVFKKANYQNDWDGTYNGATLNTGTYYYEINVGAGLKATKGTLTILKGR